MTDKPNGQALVDTLLDLRERIRSSAWQLTAAVENVPAGKSDPRYTGAILAVAGEIRGYGESVAKAVTVLERKL